MFTRAGEKAACISLMRRGRQAEKGLDSKLKLLRDLNSSDFTSTLMPLFTLTLPQLSLIYNVKLTISIAIMAPRNANVN